MTRTCFNLTRYTSVALCCLVLPCVLHAQHPAEKTGPAENTRPSDASTETTDEELPFNPSEETADATTGTFETGTNAPKGVDEGDRHDVASEYMFSDRGQSNREEDSGSSASYFEELAARYSDASFDRYVSFSRFHEAFAGNDASVLTDVILELAHAEEVLHRKHASGVTADDLLRRLSPFLAQADGKELDRIERAATAIGRKDWKEQLSSLREFASKERSPAPTISLDSISASKMAVYTAFADALRQAEMAGNQEDVKAILEELAKSEGLSDAEKEFLSSSRSAKEPAVEDDPAGELLREYSSASRESSNRNKVRANLSNGWSVIWGKNFTEADWARGLKAIAESIAMENPGPFLAWFSGVIDENFAKIERNLPGVGRRDLERWIVQSLNSKRIVTYRDFQIQAGFATYNRWERVVYDEPRSRRIPRPPFVEFYTERVEKRIPLPNWHQFHIRYKLGGGNVNVPTPGPTVIRYTITNNTRDVVTLLAKPTGSTTRLAPGASVTARSPIRDGNYPKVKATTPNGRWWERTIRKNGGDYRIVNRGSSDIQIVP